MKSLLECSKRTVSKIVQRMKLSCFNCGWNECACDIHHITPKSKGGTDEHNNLTYLCPNCHRLAHTGKLHTFKTLFEMVGDDWKKFYNITPRTKSERKFSGKRSDALAVTRKLRTEKRRQLAVKKIQLLAESGIDKTQYGWIQQASAILEIQPQSVVKYLKRWAPEQLTGAKVRMGVRQNWRAAAD